MYAQDVVDNDIEDSIGTAAQISQIDWSGAATTQEEHEYLQHSRPEDLPIAHKWEFQKRRGRPNASQEEKDQEVDEPKFLVRQSRRVLPSGRVWRGKGKGTGAKGFAKGELFFGEPQGPEPVIPEFGISPQQRQSLKKQHMSWAKKKTNINMALKSIRALLPKTHANVINDIAVRVDGEVPYSSAEVGKLRNWYFSNAHNHRKKVEAMYLNRVHPEIKNYV